MNKVYPVVGGWDSSEGTYIAKAGKRCHERVVWKGRNGSLPQ